LLVRTTSPLSGGLGERLQISPVDRGSRHFAADISPYKC
jgi:hypothetical protein